MACKKSEQTKQAHSLLLSLSCEGQLCCAIKYLYNCVLWARCSKERRSRNFIVSTYKYDIVSWWYNTTVYVKYIIHTLLYTLIMSCDWHIIWLVATTKYGNIKIDKLTYTAIWLDAIALHKCTGKIDYSLVIRWSFSL